MKTRHVVLAAVLAGIAGVVASLATNPGWLAGTRLGQRILQANAAPTAHGAARIGDPMPAMVLTTPTGLRQPLGPLLRGRVTLVNLWASWCAPCIREMPALDAFSRHQGDNGVQVVGIALDEPDAVGAFLRAHPVSYPVLLDAPGPADAGARLGDSRGVLPYSVLVGPDGRILQQRVGPLAASDLADWADITARTRD